MTVVWDALVPLSYVFLSDMYVLAAYRYLRNAVIISGGSVGSVGVMRHVTPCTSTYRYMASVLFFPYNSGPQGRLAGKI
jgi:hypothetical protein